MKAGTQDPDSVDSIDSSRPWRSARALARKGLLSFSYQTIDYKISIAEVETHPGSLEDGIFPGFTSSAVTEMGNGRSSRQLLSILWEMRQKF